MRARPWGTARVEPDCLGGCRDHAGTPARHDPPLHGLTTLAAFFAVAFCTAWSFVQVAGSVPARPLFQDGLERAAVARATARPELKPEATAGRVEHEPSPLPSVEDILIAGPHRLAIVGGAIVGAGDSVGVRAIARIERAGVLFRERSGREVYVAARPRKPPAVGS